MCSLYKVSGFLISKSKTLYKMIDVIVLRLLSKVAERIIPLFIMEEMMNKRRCFYYTLYY